MQPWTHALAIAGATLVSEDLTGIGVGLLILEGRVDATLGIAACAAGILLGDLGLWVLGRIAGRAATRPRVRWMLQRPAVNRVFAGARAVEGHLGLAILASRALPGTRVPMYVAAGMSGTRPLAFLCWTAISVTLWVPLLVLAVVLGGQVVVEALREWFSVAWLVVPVSAVAILLAGRSLALVSTRVGRSRLAARLARLWRWEFWPAWLFYAPVLAWVGWLAARHGGLGTLASANPGIADGGFVGESKAEILRALPSEWTVPFVLLPRGDASDRLRLLESAVRMRGWSFPLVLKPDIGQRGTGVRLARSGVEALAYLTEVSSAVIAQPFHPGPYEAGVFYYRRPGEPHGRIFSITDKRFPSVAGDGRSTIGSLVLAHPRYRMQARRFFDRLGPARHRVPATGEVVPLGVAGNHAQGTMFLDGAHLLTPALEARIDAIAHAVPGFFIGRFDVRYTDPAGFAAGRDLAIVELNGATSESTNIYDPSRSLLSAYRTLFVQWRLVFEIGAENRRRGCRPATAARMIALAITHLRTRSPLPVSD